MKQRKHVTPPSRAIPLEKLHNELLIKQLRQLDSEKQEGVPSVKESQRLRGKMDEWEAAYRELCEVKDHLARAYGDLALASK